MVIGSKLEFGASYPGSRPSDEKQAPQGYAYADQSDEPHDHIHGLNSDTAALGLQVQHETHHAYKEAGGQKQDAIGGIDLHHLVLIDVFNRQGTKNVVPLLTREKNIVTLTDAANQIAIDLDVVLAELATHCATFIRRRDILHMTTQQLYRHIALPDLGMNCANRRDTADGDLPPC
jgi:hypothetical protein